ncbi:MAG: diguanylate cyclase [bacterium]|nr:diguanylate cyclase [bacterium]
MAREPDATSPGHLERLMQCLEGLSDVAAEMTGNSTLKASMRIVLRLLKTTFGVSRSVLLHTQGTGRVMTVLAGVGFDDPVTLRLTDQAEKRWIAHDAPLYHEALVRDPAFYSFFSHRDNRDSAGLLPSSLWIPLIVKGKFHGILALGERENGEAYSNLDEAILMVIARQIAVALYNQVLKFDLSLRLMTTQSLMDVSNILHSSLNRSLIIRELVSQSVSLVNARRGLLMAYDPVTHEFELEQTFGNIPWAVGQRFPASELWLEEVVSAGEGAIWEGPVLLPSELDSFTCLAVPVGVRGSVIGVVAVFDKEEGLGIGTFNDHDQEILSSVARHAAASIENARLYEMATVDALTKLYIRRHFEQRLTEEVRRAIRYQAPLSLMLIDIDHFKKFNDTYGHAVGDEVLRHVAGVIRRNVREDLDIPARYGGEEMLVLMPETVCEGGVMLAERVRAAIEATELRGPKGESLRVTVSIGVASLPGDALTEEDLMERADQAMYVSKREGRNRVTRFDELRSVSEVP